MKLISVITPTHNRGKNFLLQAIKSVARQSEHGFTHEHIIVDNKSTDGTRKVVQSLAKKDKRIKYIYNPRNLGAADALNVGFKKSKGQLIVPVDDDDLLPNQSLQLRFDFFKKNPKAKWSYGSILFIDENNRFFNNLSEFIPTPPIFKNNIFLSLLAQNFIPGGSVTFHREVIKKVGGWNKDLVTQDFDMSLKLAHAKVKPYKMDAYLYFYRRHSTQIHTQQIKNGIYAKEWQYYLKLYKVTDKQIQKLKNRPK